MLAEHFITFCNEFNKFKKKGVRMLDSIYHMTLKHFFVIAFLVRKRLEFAINTLHCYAASVHYAT